MSVAVFLRTRISTLNEFLVFKMTSKKPQHVNVQMKIDLRVATARMAARIVRQEKEM